MKEEKLYRLVELLSGAAVSIVLIALVVLDNRFSYVYQSFCRVPNIVFVCIILLLLAGHFLFKRKFPGKPDSEINVVSQAPLLKLKRQLERRNLVLLSGILLGIQLIFAWQIYFKTGWDCGELVQMAQHVAYNYGDIGSDPYFSMYPNNVLLVAVFAAVLRFTKFMGFNADYFPLVMIGCLLVNLAGFFMADCIRKLTGKKWISLTAWGMYMVLVGLSPWISIPYSDTYSVLFPILCVWLYINRTEKNKYFVYAGIGFAGVIGYYIKPTVILVVVGIVAVEIWHYIYNFNKKEKKKNVRNIVCILLAVMLASLLAISANETARYKMGFTPIEGREFTPLHYVMMGLNYDTGGTYDQWDVNFSAAAANVGERNRNAINEIGRRLSDMGVGGVISHTARKLLTNFNDGTFAWGREGEFYWNIQEKNNGLAVSLRNYYYDSGTNYHIFQVVSQAMWIIILCLIVCLMLPGNSVNKRATAIIMVGILGIMCFVMVFEARARYLYLYSPLFILAAAMGLERFIGWTKQKCDKTMKTEP